MSNPPPFWSPWPPVYLPKQVTVHRQEPRIAPTDGRQRHCIMLHGWNSPWWFLYAMKEALRALPTGANWHFWLVNYPTFFWTFERCGSEVATVLHREAEQSGDVWDDVILLGFSMGGLVCRQMAAEGFPVRALLALCSPHEGCTPWVPGPTPGPLSLRPNSRYLARINSDPRDGALRSRYHFYAINHRDRFGLHRHDGLVPEASARGASLGDLAHRETITLDFGRWMTVPFSARPHIMGMSPEVMKPVLRDCVRLFGNGYHTTRRTLLEE